MRTHMTLSRLDRNFYAIEFNNKIFIFQSNSILGIIYNAIKIRIKLKWQN